MKKTLLLIATALMTTVASFAQTWTAPTPKVLDGPVEDTVYIYNVAGNAFLGMGNAWGTQASIRQTDLCFLLNDSVTVDDATRTGWTIMTASGSKAGKYVCNLGAAACYVDMGTQNTGTNLQSINFWSIEKQEATGYYRIRPIAADPTYGVEALTQEVYDGQYLGWTPGEAGELTIVDPAADPSNEINGCDWQFVTPANYTYFAAKKNLYDQLVASEQYSSVDRSAEAAVYNNADATVEELKAAYESLYAKNRQAEVYVVLEGASEENPKDATSLLVNPDFETGNITGWECTFVSGTTATNIGYQSASYTNGDVTISKFIEAWAAASTNFNPNVSFRAIGDAELQQTLPSLPAGKYKLTCDAIANQQDNAVTSVTGVQLFATGGDVDSYTTISTGNGLPEHFELEFISSGGDISMGLRTRNCTANWIAADNFTLTYYGATEEDPYKMALDNYIAKVEEKYPDIDDVKANATVKQEYTEGLEAAKSATENYQEAQATFEAVVAKLDASVAEYVTFKAALTSIEAKIEKVIEPFPDLASDLQEYYDGLKTKYDEETATAEDFASVDETVQSMISAYVSEHCEPGTDVTILLNNPGFDTNFSGWTVTGSTPAWGGANANPNGDLTGHEDLEEYKTTGLPSGDAEVYHAAFDISQTIKGMPRGLFQITCQAFERDDDGTGVNAEVYAVLPDASEQTQKITNLQDDPSETQLFSDGTWWDDVASASGEGYVPYGMPGANWHFAAGYYKNAVDVVMTEAGDLTVGIRTTSTGDWVLFDDFKIIYKGAGVAVYADAINKLIAEAQALPDEGAISKATQATIDDAITAAEDALQGTDEDAAIAAMNGLKAAIAAGKASQELSSQLEEEYSLMNDYRLPAYEEISTDGTLEEYLGEVSSALDDGDFESDQAIKDYMTGMKAHFTNYVQCDHLDATEDAPFDMTPVIYNTKGVDMATSEQSSNGWETNPGSFGLDGNSFELYNQKFDAFQTIYNLAPGYYRLKVQGFYRNGWNENVAKAMRGEKYEKITLDTISTDPLVVDTLKDSVAYANLPLVALYAGNASTSLALTSQDVVAYNEQCAEIEGFGGQEYAIDAAGTTMMFVNSMSQAAIAFEAGLYENTLQFQVTERGDVNIGLKKTVEENGDWTIFTNWRLEYIGTATPSDDPTTAIKAVEVADNSNIAADRIYNLNGQLVSRAQKGIYIINGKKVVVK